MPEATATSPAPTQTAAPAATTPIQDAYADLDQMVSAGEAASEGASPESSAASAAKPSPDKPSRSGKSEDPKDKSPDSSASDAAAKKPESKPGEGKPHISELRTAYEALKAKHKQLEAEHAAWKAKPPEDPEKKVLQERYETAEKRRQELENEIRFKKYEASEEYKEQYEKPFVNAYQTARQKVTSLKTLDAEGNVRQGTPEDFDRIVQIADDDAAAELAQEMFGAKAPVVLYHRERVQELNGNRVRAIEDFRKQGLDREKQQGETQAKTREQLGRLWQEENAKAVEKYPQWFKPAEGDEEEKAIIEKSFELVDRGFHEPNGMSPEEVVRLHAAIRNRAAGFALMVHRNKKLASRNEELEKELGQFKKSEPSGGDGSPEAGKQAGEETLDSVMNQLDKMAR